MTNYSDIEIQTAENLLEQGYKWLMRNSFGTLFTYGVKQVDPEKYVPGIGIYVCSCFVPIFQSVKSCDEHVSLEAIVHPQILDDAEKRYLKGVIRPFKDKVLYIAKRSFRSDSTIEYISIQLAESEYTCLPRFKKGSMYKGMEPDRGYTLEELGL